MLKEDHLVSGGHEPGNKNVNQACIENWMLSENLTAWWRNLFEVKSGVGGGVIKGQVGGLGVGSVPGGNDAGNNQLRGKICIGR